MSWFGLQLEAHEVIEFDKEEIRELKKVAAEHQADWVYNICVDLRNEFAILNIGIYNFHSQPNYILVYIIGIYNLRLTGSTIYIMFQGV